MEKQGDTGSSKPLGMCEKVFNALKIPMLRSSRRISYKQETAAAPTASSKPPAATDSGSKLVSAESKPPTPVQPKPIEGARNTHVPVPEKKITEVAPIAAPVPPPIITEERMKQAQSTEQQKARVASKIEKKELAPPTASVAGQGRPKVSTNPVPLHTQVQVKEKATDQAQAPALTAAPAGEAHGKPAKVEPTPLPAAKLDKERAGPRQVIENINDRVVDYINRAKVKLRADSSVGRPGKSASG